MKPARQAREDYVAWCLAQLKEAPWEVPAGSNRNDYSKELGYAPDAWCVDFGQAGLHATGSGGGIIPTRSTLTHINWAKTVGRHRSRMNPARGALAGVAKNGTSVHTDACVINASTKRLVAIGGNTSNRGGSTADGGGVYANDRTYMLGDGTYRIYGFTVPFFGITVQDALDIQGALGVKRTGYITPETVTAVRRFQASKGLTADGYPGPATYAALGGTSHSAAPAAEEDDMTPDQDAALKAIYETQKRHTQQITSIENTVTAPDGTGRKADERVLGFLAQRYESNGKPARAFDNMDGAYLLAQVVGQLAGLTAAITQIAAGQGIDLAAITAAAEKGAKEGAASVSAADVAAKLTVQTKA